MKLALRRRANQKLVARRDEVMALIARLNALQPAGVEAMLVAARAIDEEADQLGLEVTGDDWGERLLIKAKGGGHHFDDVQRAAAAAAHRRGAAMHSAARWTEQLRACAKQLERATVRAEGAGRAQLLERARELVASSKKTVEDICEEGPLRRAEAEMAQLRVPQAIRAEAAAVCDAAVPLAGWAHALCAAEQSGLRAEAKMTQRFRACSTMAILRAGEQLLLDVQAMIPDGQSVTRRFLDELRRAVAEVQPLVGTFAAGSNELDDEI